jgi:hypothetical protein
VPVNDHRAELSPAQYDWPKATLETPEGSPLLAGAGGIRGFVDTVIYLIKTLLLPKAEMLEVLDEYLRNKLGPKWWENTPLERFAPKPKRSASTARRPVTNRHPRVSRGRGPRTKGTLTEGTATPPRSDARFRHSSSPVSA